MMLPALPKLKSGQRYPLTLLIAPAGSGKSALLRHWTAAVSSAGDPRVAWLTLQNVHNHPGRFLADLAQALQTVGIPSAQQVAALPPERAATLLINAMADITEDFTLVLDAYQRVSAPEVHQFLTLLLDYPPPALHLVIASRSEPPLPLARLRARRQLIEIGPEDLIGEQPKAVA
jgi:LuxR family maltose regulon positive regulatory protein